MIKFKKIMFTTMCLTMLVGGTSVFAASDAKNYQPIEKVIDGITYLDNILLYTHEDVKSGKVSEDLHAGKIKVNRPISLMSTRSNTKNEWVLTGTSNIYQGHDYDHFNNSGSTEAKIGGRVGSKWGKTISDVYRILAGWVTEQKTACRVPVYSYKYVKDGIFGESTYYAEAYGKNGTETWIYSNPIK